MAEGKPSTTISDEETTEEITMREPRLPFVPSRNVGSGLPQRRTGRGHTLWLVARRNTPAYTTLMTETVFRLIAQKDKRISVEMVKSNGQRRLIPDFRDEPDARAWIVQIQRVIQAGHPRLPGTRRDIA